MDGAGDFRGLRVFLGEGDGRFRQIFIKKIKLWWGHIISYIPFYNPIMILNPRKYLGIII